MWCEITAHAIQLDCNFGHTAIDHIVGSSRNLDCIAASRTIADHILGYTAVGRTASSDHSTTVAAAVSSSHNTANSNRILGYRTTDRIPSCQKPGYLVQYSSQ